MWAVQLALRNGISKRHLFPLRLFVSMCMGHYGRIWKEERHGLLGNEWSVCNLKLVFCFYGDTCMLMVMIEACNSSWNSSMSKSINISKLCFVVIGWCKLEKNFVAVSLKFCKNLSENKVLTISKLTTGETPICAVDESNGIYFSWV